MNVAFYPKITSPNFNKTMIKVSIRWNCVEQKPVYSLVAQPLKPVEVSLLNIFKYGLKSNLNLNKA